jgi:hypothetical protein
MLDLLFSTKHTACKLCGGKDVRTWQIKSGAVPVAHLLRADGKITPLYAVERSAAEKLKQQDKKD